MILNSDPFNYLLKRYDAEINVLLRNYSNALVSGELPQLNLVQLHNMLIGGLNQAYDILEKTMNDFTEVINYVK